ncbi:MAG: 5'-methylthioadenosine/adenosylhomocysteine nucleosidase [Clostridia bacterium]|nr:5'-methylthioadenosine/adenosylhomocysteine nucleosidase [Clostridia bacterium]
MKYKKIGVICAMKTEAEQILSAMNGKETKTVGSMEFHVGTIGKKDVILCVCGIGKVFAAMCAQTMILTFSPDCLINSGVAGSLTDALDILDIAVAEDLVQHDMDTSPLGDPVGLISGINVVELPADPSLAEDVCKAAASLEIPTKKGRIASGDQFIATPAQKERIKALFDPIACEMEGGAIAQVAFVNRVPFACIRAISDSYSGKNEMDYPVFADKAAARGASILIKVLEG